MLFTPIYASQLRNRALYADCFGAAILLTVSVFNISTSPDILASSHDKSIYTRLRDHIKCISNVEVDVTFSDNFPHRDVNTSSCSGHLNHHAAEQIYCKFDLLKALLITGLLFCLLFLLQLCKVATEPALSVDNNVGENARIKISR